MNTKTYSVLLALALFVAPGVAASHDNDPVPDSTETIVCGDPTLPGLLASLGLGSCTEGDYQLPTLDVLEARPAVCDASTACHQDLLVLERTQLFAGHDVEAVPLPPEDVESIPVTTPPVDLPVTLSADPENPHRICVTVLPEENLERVCIDFGPVLGPAFGEALPLEQVPGQSEETPFVGSGEAGSSPPQHVPALSVEASLGVDWVDDMLNEQVTTNSLGSYWMPVNILDPGALEWWFTNAESTSLTLTVTVFIDDAALEGPEPLDAVSFPLSVEVPYLGQAVAAMLASGN